VFAKFTREIKPQSRYLRPAYVLAVAMSTVCLLSVSGLVATAQETSTLLVLRPKLKDRNADKIDTVEPGVDSSIIEPVVQSDVSEIRIGGKPATITAWTPLLNGPTKLQLVVLFDSQLRIGMGHQFDEIKKLFNSLPSNVEIAVGFLLQGKAVIKQPFTADRTLAGNALHLPTILEALNPKNDNGDPYSCLHDLAVHWPDPDPKKVRAVLVFPGGHGNHYASQGLDQTDHEVVSVSDDLIRAGIAPFSIDYVPPEIPIGSPGSVSGGISDQLSKMTNGEAISYYGVQGTTSTSLDPLLYRFYSILYSEAVVTVTAKGTGLQRLDIKSSNDAIKVVGPDQVMIGNELPTK
jgi:hypothetical protein